MTSSHNDSAALSNAQQGHAVTAFHRLKSEHSSIKVTHNYEAISPGGIEQRVDWNSIFKGASEFEETELEGA